MMIIIEDINNNHYNDNYENKFSNYQINLLIIFYCYSYLKC